MNPEDLQTYIAQQEANGAHIKALSTFSVPVNDGEIFSEFDEKIVPIEWENDKDNAKGVYFGFSYNGKVVPFSLFTKVRNYLDKDGNLHALNPSGDFVDLLNSNGTPTKENFETIIKWLKEHKGKVQMKITPYNNYKNGGYIIYTYELIAKD